ncbi:MAG: glycosyltransferase [Chloroflexi bacterium]|nr:glycosyltransferase [Chloroflexota bacterium]
MNVYVREVSRQLAARGVDVDVFTRRQDPRTPDVVEISPGARVIHLDAGSPRHFDKYAVQDYLPEFACNLQRFRLLSGQAYDLIHAHYWLSTKPALLLRGSWRTPVVVQFHTLAELKNQVAQDDAEREQRVRFDVERRAVTEADTVIAATSLERDVLVQTYGATPSRIAIVPGGVDLSRFQPADAGQARARLGLPSDQAVLLFVGRIQKLKGIDVLLRAAALLQRTRRVTTVVVGGIPGERGQRRTPEQREIERLRLLAERLGLANVRFEGAVEQEQLAHYYNAADVTVMPSTYESFGLVAAESLACGTPVVASRVGGLRTIVQDGRTGILIPWRDPRLFAAKIDLLLTNPDLRRSMRAAAVQAMQQLGWQQTADRFIDLYQALATGGLGSDDALVGAPARV